MAHVFDEVDAKVNLWSSGLCTKANDIPEASVVKNVSVKIDNC